MRFFGGAAGLEPATFGVTDHRASRELLIRFNELRISAGIVNTVNARCGPPTAISSG